MTRLIPRAMALAALATTLAATPAAAVITLSSSPGAPDPAIPSGFTTVVTFDAPSATGIVNTIVGNVITSAANTSGVRAAPAGTAPGGVYQSVGLPSTSASTFDFTNYLGPSRYLTGFSFYWGSVDPSNRVEFFNDSNSLVQFFLGTDLPAATGNQILSQTNRRATFNIDGMDRITKVRFSSNNNAFEYDTFAVTDGPLPEPGSWVLMITGFGFIGAAMRRRVRQAARA